MINTRVLGYSTLGVLIVLAFAPLAGAQTPTLASVEDVICGDRVDVFGENLKKIIGEAAKFEVVKKFQGFGGSGATTKKLGNDEYLKVKFEANKDSDLQIGWVASSLVAPKSQCGGALEAEKKQVIEANKEKEKEIEVSRSLMDLGKNISGLNDNSCCFFPLKQRPNTPYTSGMRMFGARRSGGKRIHAASDLYQYKNAPIVSVANGKAISDLYFFYQGTYALEVKHAGGFVVRYGEMTGKQAKGVRSGSALMAGQEIGYMGKVNSGCCTPMLHFELYKGTLRGSLTTGGRGYQRRADLINPTNYLLRWEEKAL